jgi:predicted GNAT family N-acyltransferase
MGIIKIEKFTTEDKKKSEIAFSIRRKVFVEEQNVDPEEEYDEFEDLCTHYLLYFDGKPVATARWQITGKGIKPGRFAMLKEYRGKGIGSELLKQIMKDIIPLKKPIYLNSQVTAVSYYARFGFVKKGDVFLEAGIEHYLMEYEG